MADGAEPAGGSQDGQKGLVGWEGSPHEGWGLRGKGIYSRVGPLERGWLSRVQSGATAAKPHCILRKAVFPSVLPSELCSERRC